VAVAQEPSLAYYEIIIAKVNSDQSTVVRTGMVNETNVFTYLFPRYRPECTFELFTP